MAQISRRVKRGSTSQSVVVRLQNQISFVAQVSASDATAGLVMKYWKLGGRSFDVSIAPVSIADLSSAFNSGGIKHIANGWYRVDVPDAAFATGDSAYGVLVTVEATAVISDGAFVELTDYNPQTNVAQSTPEKY